MTDAANCGPDTARLAEAFAHALSGGESLDPSLIANLQIWVSGQKWWSGDLDPDRAAAVQERFHQCFVGGRRAVTTTILSIIATERQAFIELRQRGPWHDGRTYDMPFVIVLDVQNGRIVRLREYIADDTFFGLVQE